MTYANVFSPRFIDEARYQTIGRGHGFSELDGVPFKISEKYTFTKNTYQVPSHNVYQLSCNQTVEMATSIEQKVLNNMGHEQHRL